MTPVTPAELFAFLDAHGIAHSTTQHPPLFTVSESAALKADLPGGHTKNLFMKDKSGALILISAEAHASIRLNRLHRHLGTGRLSFTDADLLHEVLGVRPGSVTAFSLINDRACRVRFILDATLMETDPVNFHPLVNTATTAISRDDLLKFARLTGHDPEIIDFSILEGEAD